MRVLVKNRDFDRIGISSCRTPGFVRAEQRGTWESNRIPPPIEVSSGPLISGAPNLPLLPIDTVVACGFVPCIPPLPDSPQ